MRASMLIILLVCPCLLLAQPTVTGVNPAQHQNNAARDTNVVSDFSANMSAPAAGDITVHGSASGSRAGSITGGGTSQLTFDPAEDFHAGEEVEVTLTTALEDTTMAALAAPYVYRFRAATAVSSGTFLSETDISSNNHSGAIAAGDFDDDGDIDLAIGHIGAVGTIHFNDGVGVFTATGTWGNAGDDPFFLRAGDVTGDGVPDLVQAVSGSLRVLENDGAGNFTTIDSMSRSLSVCACFSLADMDGDGDLDIVASCRNSQGDRPAIYPNSGTGTFGAPVTFGSNTINYFALETGDLDNDGDIDVAISMESVLIIYLNDGTGTMTYLTDHTYGTTLNIEDIELADFDNDGDLDCVISALNSDCRYAMNDGAAGFPSWSSLFTNKVTGLASGDLNGDGYLDLVVSSRSAGGGFGYGDNRIFLTAAGSIGAGSTISLPGNTPVCGLVLADLDGSATLDVAAATGSTLVAREDYVKLSRLYEGTLSVGALTEPTNVSSVAGSPVDVFDFTIADSGGAPGIQLRIDKIYVDVTGALGDCTWRLRDSASLNCVGTVSSNQVEFNVSSGYPLWYPIPDNTAVTLTMSVEFGTGTPQTPDNHIWSISLPPNGVVFRGGGQFFPAQPTIDNGAGLTFEVVATEVRVAQQPPAIALPFTAFPVSVAYTDAIGYRDFDVNGDTISMLRDDAGAVLQGSTVGVVQGLADFSGGNAVILGGPENLALQLEFSDDAGGSVNFSMPVLSQVFALYIDDADSLLAAGSLVEPASIDSVGGAAGFINVLDFRIIDLGTADGKPTVVNDIEIDLAGSTGDALDGNWQLTSTGLNATGVVAGSAGSQVVQFSGVNFSVADGTQATLALGLQLAAAPGATLDGDTWAIVIRTSGLSQVAGSTTTFATGQPGVGNSGNPLVYDVVATQLSVYQQPPAQVIEGVSFSVGVEFTDAAGNRDTGVNGDVVGIARSDAGDISSPLTVTAANGVGAFTGGNAVVLAGAAAGITLVFTDDAAGDADLSSSPVQSSAFDVLDAPSSGGSGDDGEEESCSTNEKSGWIWMLSVAVLCAVALRRRSA